VVLHDVDVDDEGLDRDADGDSTCPDCSDAMRFERSTGGDCTC